MSRQYQHHQQPLLGHALITSTAVRDLWKKWKYSYKTDTYCKIRKGILHCTHSHARAGSESGKRVKADKRIQQTHFHLHRCNCACYSGKSSLFVASARVHGNFMTPQPFLCSRKLHFFLLSCSYWYHPVGIAAWGSIPRHVENEFNSALVLRIPGQEIVGLDWACIGELVHRVAPLKDSPRAHARSCDRHPAQHGKQVYQHDVL
jgi:hypothetical protein